MIKVLFRVDKDGNLVAFFPAMAGDRFWLQSCLTYSDGLFNTCTLNYYYYTRPARPEEYMGMFITLQRLYDNGLRIVTRIMATDADSRRRQVQNDK